MKKSACKGREVDDSGVDRHESSVVERESVTREASISMESAPYQAFELSGTCMPSYSDHP
jgi:hypothetical protein